MGGASEVILSRALHSQRPRSLNFSYGCFLEGWITAAKTVYLDSLRKPSRLNQDDGHASSTHSSPCRTWRSNAPSVTNTRLRVFSSGKNDACQAGPSTMPTRSSGRCALRGTKVGVALLRPTANHLDQLVSRLTWRQAQLRRDRNWRSGGHPTTTGAKSGEPRTVTVYGIPHPDGLGLIASNWGGAKYPAWYQSQGQPGGHGIYRGRYWHATARPATPSERDESGRKASRSTPPVKKYEARGGRTPDRGVRPHPELSPDQDCVRLRRPSSTGTLSPGPVARPRFRWVHSRMCSEY